MILPLIKVLSVIALLIVAALLATPPGRIPLALRGVYRILQRDRGLSTVEPATHASTPRRLWAFVLLLVAAIVILI